MSMQLGFKGRKNMWIAGAYSPNYNNYLEYDSLANRIKHAMNLEGEWIQ